MRAVTLMVIYRSAADRYVRVNVNALNNIEFIGAGLHGLHIIKLVATSPDIRRGCPNRPVERTCTCALFGPHQYNIILANPRWLLPNFELSKNVLLLRGQNRSA